MKKKKKKKKKNMTKTPDVGAFDKAAASALSLAGNHRELTIPKIMSTTVITVTSSDTILSAATKMSENNVSCVIVVDDGHVAGILTQKDVLQAVAGDDANFHLHKVSQRMSKPAQAISVDRSVIEAVDLMESKGIKRLPVIQGRKLVGIVTQTDITRGLISLTELQGVADIMSTNIATVDAETTVLEAARIMSSRNVSFIVAEYQHYVAGVLTEKDVLKRVVALSKNPTQTQVADVMSSPVQSVTPSCSILSASKMMEQMHIHRLVIVDGKKVCGAVTQTDVMRAVRAEFVRKEQERLRLIDDVDDLVYYVTTDLQKLHDFLQGTRGFPRLFSATPHDLHSPAHETPQPCCDSL